LSLVSVMLLSFWLVSSVMTQLTYCKVRNLAWIPLCGILAVYFSFMRRVSLYFWIARRCPVAAQRAVPSIFGLRGVVLWTRGESCSLFLACGTLSCGSEESVALYLLFARRCSVDARRAVLSIFGLRGAALWTHVELCSYLLFAWRCPVEARRTFSIFRPVWRCPVAAPRAVLPIFRLRGSALWTRGGAVLSLSLSEWVSLSLLC